MASFTHPLVLCGVELTGVTRPGKLQIFHIDLLPCALAALLSLQFVLDLAYLAAPGFLFREVAVLVARQSLHLEPLRPAPLACRPHAIVHDVARAA